MGADHIASMYDNSPSEGGGPLRRKKNSGSRSKQGLAAFANSNSQVALLPINRDALSQSHRNINKKVKNARDVFKIQDYNLEQKFQKYESAAASRPSRMNSSIGNLS